ncbi:hypothetical protein K2X92_02895, partial [Candidatus Gracilibacteria bacterium]|nr:hypothetical protein [Candidatus Gracilibacteria bacterium]
TGHGREVAETNTGHGREVAETNTGHGREVAETNTGHGYSSESYAYQDDMNLTGDDLAMNGANVVSGIEVDPIILGTVV